MQRLQAATKGAQDLRLVSITVDPSNDTPEALSSWADALGADRSRWLFLRAEEGDLRRLMKDGMKVPTPDDVTMHSNLFVLVDPDGAVRGRYEPLEHANWLDALLADLGTLRAERRAR
jgi:cytochrome oxidase Cu insertion factor (SCO1/SenC/PrrC family)